MSLYKKQKELDDIKWLKSEEIGTDACGTLDFCEKCDKTLENPCEKAYKKYNAKARTKKAADKAPAKTLSKADKVTSKSSPKTAVKEKQKKLLPKISP